MSEVTGCGMLPISMKNNELYVLCGIHKNKISDLGGRIEKGETSKECAAREFYEESVGLIDSYENLLKYKIYHIAKLSFHGKCYISYIIKTEYIDIKDKYKKLYQYIQDHDSISKKIKLGTYYIDQLYNENIYPCGFFELDEIKWILLNDLIKMIKNKDRTVSYRLRNIIYQLPI